MDPRFPRGTLPPSKFPKPARAGESPNRACDLASACPQCGTMMEPEHAHYRCQRCGYRDSCCF